MRKSKKGIVVKRTENNSVIRKLFDNFSTYETELLWPLGADVVFEDDDKVGVYLDSPANGPKIIFYNNSFAIPMTSAEPIEGFKGLVSTHENFGPVGFLSDLNTKTPCLVPAESLSKQVLDNFPSYVHWFYIEAPKKIETYLTLASPVQQWQYKINCIRSGQEKEKPEYLHKYCVCTHRVDYALCDGVLREVERCQGGYNSLYRTRIGQWYSCVETNLRKCVSMNPINIDPLPTYRHRNPKNNCEVDYVMLMDTVIAPTVIDGQLCTIHGFLGKIVFPPYARFHQPFVMIGFVWDDVNNYNGLNCVAVDNGHGLGRIKNLNGKRVKDFNQFKIVVDYAAREASETVNVDLAPFNYVARPPPIVPTASVRLNAEFPELPHQPPNVGALRLNGGSNVECQGGSVYSVSSSTVSKLSSSAAGRVFAVLPARPPKAKKKTTTDANGAAEPPKTLKLKKKTGLTKKVRNDELQRSKIESELYEADLAFDRSSICMDEDF